MNAPRLIRKLAFAALAYMLPLSALAAPPQVVASIRPVQALALAVMGEIGTPQVLLPAGVSPHAFTLKPSQAQALQDADLVFWIGPELETALEAPLATLATGARVVKLLDAPGLELLHYDQGDARRDAHDEHGHGHEPGAVDPHVWLSPRNAQALVAFIAEELARANPGNADLYAKNAKLARNRLKLLERKGAEMLADVKDVPYIVQHDGFGYVARDFGLTEVGALQTLPGREPGAKHLSEMRAAITEHGVKCLFHEPQFTPKQAQRLARATGVRLGELDPLGADLELSPTLPVRIIQQIIVNMENCLHTPVDTQVDSPTQQ